MNNSYAVIMAGGSGTRFWPLSREKMPKQLLRIAGEGTLIQQTVKRIMPLIKKDHTLIVCNRELAESIGIQLQEKCGGNWGGSFILEPVAKNTAPALGLAALRLSQRNPDSIMVVLSADHFIKKDKLFLDLLTKATEAAKHDYLVTLGIKPTRPETGYGYIKAGEKCPVSKVEDLYKVSAYVEKPDLKRAKMYLEDGSYYWNSGMFVWKTATFLMEIERHYPVLFQGLMKIKNSTGSGKEGDVAKDVFLNLDSISVDYAVMEKTSRAAIIPADIGWSDVGSWGALDEVADRNASGNIITGNVIDIGSKDSVIYADKRLVATIGLKDTVVVDTADATLVCSKKKSQEVKKIVDELRRLKRKEQTVHCTVHRPWGSYTILEEGERYKVKRLEVKPHARLSLQLHRHRNEHLVVVSGTAHIINGDLTFNLNPNESTYIPAQSKHRLENQGTIPLQLIEIQHGDYLAEDDIVRLDDDYQRHKSHITKHEGKS